MQTRFGLRARWLAAAVTLGILSRNPAVLRADVPDPARLISASAVAYVELSQPDNLIGPLVAPTTFDLLQGLEAYRKYVESNEFGQLKAVVNLLEVQLETDWRAANSELLGGGIYLAADPASDSALLIVRSRNATLLNKLNASLAALIAADAASKGKPSPVNSKEYQGHTGWTFGPNEFHVIVDDLLIVSNKSDALKAAVDRHHDLAAQGLSGVPAFQQARSQVSPGALGWAWAGLEAVRKAPQFEKALNAPSDNPLAELLLGGVLDTMRHAPYAATELLLEANQLRLRTWLPRDASQTAAARSWYFAAEREQGAPAALKPVGTLANFAMCRDLAGLWLAREELFNEAVVAGFAQADTQLGLFFSGRDFGPEVLGELAPQLQFVVARQEFADGQPVPAIKVPAMALVLRMKHPDEFATHLLIAYQRIIGLVNIQGGQAGQPGLLLETETYHEASISKATYVADKVQSGQAPINYNFSPACARVGEHFIYGSTVGIVRQLVDELKKPAAAAPTADNLSLALESAPLAASLEDNRELLISQNMLSEGHGREDAERNINALIYLVRLGRHAGLTLTAAPEELILEASVEFQPPNP